MPAKRALGRAVLLQGHLDRNRDPLPDDVGDFGATLDPREVQLREQNRYRDSPCVVRQPPQSLDDRPSDRGLIHSAPLCAAHIRQELRVKLLQPAGERPAGAEAVHHCLVVCQKGNLGLKAREPEQLQME